MSTISAIVLTLNEEKNIEKCLQSLQFCDEVIVVDSGSTDKTVKIAKSFGAKIFQNIFIDFAKQRQFASTKATCEWILYIDADEVVSEKCAKKLLDLKNDKTLGTIVIPRKNFFMGKWIQYGGWYPDWQRRMLRRDKVIFKTKRVHELAEEIPEVLNLSNEWHKDQVIYHYTYNSLANYLNKLNKYTSLEAKDLQDSLRVKKRDVLFRSLGMFWQTYFAKKAYRDGIQGFVIAIISMIYSFMLMIKIIELKKCQK